jgi:hypothetical protein
MREDKKGEQFKVKDSQDKQTVDDKKESSQSS